tara:strand:+ start:177 stop:836 length:660 start_codon:yes stop_codon:yes gene_type:complete
MTWQDILKMANKWDRYSAKALKIAEGEGKERDLVRFLRFLPSMFSKTMDSKQYNKIWQETVVENFGPSQTLNYLSLFRVGFYRDPYAFLPEQMEAYKLYGPSSTLDGNLPKYTASFTGIKNSLESRKREVAKFITGKNLNNIFIVYRTKQKSYYGWEKTSRDADVYYLSNGFIFSVRIGNSYKTYFNKHIKGSPYVFNYLDTTKKSEKAKTKIIRGGYI